MRPPRDTCWLSEGPRVGFLAGVVLSADITLQRVVVSRLQMFTSALLLRFSRKFERCRQTLG